MIDKQLMQKNVSVDGKTFYDHYYIVHDGSSSTVLIGDSFRVKFTDNVPGCSMEYKAAHMLRILLSDSSFMLAAIESNGFEVGGARIEFDKSRMDLSHFNVETQKYVYLRADAYKYIGQTLLIRPDINSDKDLLKLNKAIEDKQYVKRTYYAFLYNNSNSKDLKDIILQDNKKFEEYDEMYTAKQTVQKVRRK